MVTQLFLVQSFKVRVLVSQQKSRFEKSGIFLFNQVLVFRNKIKLSYAGKSITVKPTHNYPYLQLYTPDDRKSIAIENLSGAPNAFNNKIGLHIVKPQDKIVFETGYQIAVK